MKEFFKKNEIKIVFTVFIILSAVYLSLVWNNNVWMDEAFTASLVHTDFRGVIERSMADTLPPLYNIILKLATDIFGYTIPVMKITSVVPMLLTLLLGATVVRKRFGFRTALLFMLFITFMPLFMYYGVEIRMYSLGFSSRQHPEYMPMRSFANLRQKTGRHSRCCPRLLGIPIILRLSPQLLHIFTFFVFHIHKKG